MKYHDLIWNLRWVKIENRIEAHLTYYKKFRLLITDTIYYLLIEAGDAKILFDSLIYVMKKEILFLTAI